METRTRKVREFGRALEKALGMEVRWSWERSENGGGEVAERGEWGVEVRNLGWFWERLDGDEEGRVDETSWRTDT